LILYFIIKPISYEAYRYLHIPFGWTWRARKFITFSFIKLSIQLFLSS
jgi:hypothetical protein